MISHTREKRTISHVRNLESPEIHVAERAERMLIRYYAGCSVPYLLPICGSENPVARFRAVWILGKSWSPAAYDTILILCGDLDDRVRYDAVLALGNLGDHRAVPELMAMALEDDPNVPARSALKLLGWTGVDDD